jgi:hypothetical protein
MESLMSIALSASGPALAAVLLLMAAGAARADTIDGNWCNGEGGHFSIQGPHITTDTGRTLDGRYYGHAFSYVIPTPEADAGESVQMVLLDDTTLDLHIGSGADAQSETWRRCGGAG